MGHFRDLSRWWSAPQAGSQSPQAFAPFCALPCLTFRLGNSRLGWVDGRLSNGTSLLGDHGCGRWTVCARHVWWHGVTISTPLAYTLGCLISFVRWSNQIICWQFDAICTVLVLGNMALILSNLFERTAFYQLTIVMVRYRSLFFVTLATALPLRKMVGCKNTIDWFCPSFAFDEINQ